MGCTGYNPAKFPKNFYEKYTRYDYFLGDIQDERENLILCGGKKFKLGSSSSRRRTNNKIC